MPGYTSFKLDAVSFMRPDYVPLDASQAEYDKKVIQPGLVSHDDFEITETPITSGVQQGQKVTAKKKKIGKITIFDLAALARLKEWEKENIPIHVYGAGNEFLLWEKPSHFNISRSLKTKDGLQGFDVEIETNESLVNPLIKWGTNLLFLKTGGWKDSNADGLADGYFTNSFAKSFIDGVQTITADDLTSDINITINFPVKTNILYSHFKVTAFGLNDDLCKNRNTLKDYFGNTIYQSDSGINSVSDLNNQFIFSGNPFRITLSILQRATAGQTHDLSFEYPVISNIPILRKAEY